MIKSILVATDGSSLSRVALDYALHLASLFEARITGLNVVDIRALEGPFLSDISGSLGFTPYQNYLPTFQKVLEDRSEVILEGLKSYCEEQGVHPEIKQTAGVVPNVIAEEAKRVDLVVIAQRGEHEQWSSGLLGSTTESVVRKSPRPVLVTPSEFRRFETMLVAYDGGRAANRALRTACELLSGLEARLRVAFVSGDTERFQALAEEVEAFVSPYRIETSLERLEGDAGKALLGLCESEAVDLIVMGASRHGRLHDLLLGTTSAYVIRHTRIPVLLDR